jgi:hypothetical protein
LLLVWLLLLLLAEEAAGRVILVKGEEAGIG